MPTLGKILGLMALCILFSSCGPVAVKNVKSHVDYPAQAKTKTGQAGAKEDEGQPTKNPHVMAAIKRLEGDK